MWLDGGMTRTGYGRYFHEGFTLCRWRTYNSIVEWHVYAGDVDPGINDHPVRAGFSTLREARAFIDRQLAA